ncbi:30S ribosomal protein S9, partial [bacterium]|nr:30S ribosomal protein S9 [bacterium]
MTSVIQYYGTGRRKTATARVRLLPGKGQMTINGRTVEDYVGGRHGLEKVFEAPFQLTDAVGRFDVMISVRGGGIVGQMGAIRHGIARALTEANPANRPV